MRNYQVFTNDSGVEYKVKALNKFFIGVVAEQRAGEKPKQPRYLHTYHTPTGESHSEWEFITQDMIDSGAASVEEIRLWSSYRVKLSNYNAKINKLVNTLTMCRSFVDNPPAEFLAELEADDLTDSLSKDEIKLLWVVSKVAPTSQELERLKEILEKLNGVKSDDIEKVADDFRSDLQGQ